MSCRRAPDCARKSPSPPPFFLFPPLSPLFSGAIRIVDRLVNASPFPLPPPLSLRPPRGCEISRSKPRAQDGSRPPIFPFPLPSPSPRLDSRCDEGRPIGRRVSGTRAIAGTPLLPSLLSLFPSAQPRSTCDCTAYRTSFLLRLGAARYSVASRSSPRWTPRSEGLPLSCDGGFGTG